MTTLTLNQCMGVPDGEAFYPRVEQTTTAGGMLKVRRVGPGALTVENIYGGADIRYRFGFTAHRDSTLARQLRVQQALFFGVMTSFSGTATKDSLLLKRVVSWDLIPLRRGQEIVRLNCSAYVEALP